MLRMDTFHALADPNRRQIMEMLAREGELSATEIHSRFLVSAPAVSQHLKVLREAGLVHMEKRAQQRIYRVAPEAMREVEDWASAIRNQWARRFDALDALLKEEGAKPPKEQE